MSSHEPERTIPTIDVTATLGEVARRLRAADADAIVILRDGEPVGVMTERELVDAVAASRHPDHGTAELFMRTDVIAVAGDGQGATRRLPDGSTIVVVGQEAGAALPRNA